MIRQEFICCGGPRVLLRGRGRFLRQHGEGDGALGLLQDAHGLLVGHALQRHAVHRHDLVPALQAPVLRRRALGTQTVRHTRWQTDRHADIGTQTDAQTHSRTHTDTDTDTDV